jgi:hypothetical protein
MKERNKDAVVVLVAGLNDHRYRSVIAQKLYEDLNISDWQWNRALSDFNFDNYPDHDITGIRFKHAADATVYKLSMQNA